MGTELPFGEMESSGDGGAAAPHMNVLHATEPDT